MALDHYVSQVHLKNFYSQALDCKQLYAIRKADQYTFTTGSRAICQNPDGSTNDWLNEPRIVEEFLKEIEPKYNLAVSKLVSSHADTESVYVIAGFLAYILTCSPAGMRLNSKPFHHVAEETTRRLDRKGVIGPAPAELGGKTISEMIDDGDITLTVDQKYPQALGISSILEFASVYGNSNWDVLINEFDDTPFFTSDFPVAIESVSLNLPLNRIIPLTPRVALRIFPDPSHEFYEVDLSFPRFRYKVRKVSRKEVSKINRLIVQSAEGFVFFRDNHEWVSRFVHRNSGYRIEQRTDRIPHKGGVMLVCRLEITR